MEWAMANWQGILSLVALIGVVGLTVQLMASHASRGGAAGTVHQDTRGVSVQVGADGGGSHPCQAAGEHSIYLRRLADVQDRQVALDERMAALLERTDARLAKIEMSVLEILVTERER